MKKCRHAILIVIVLTAFLFTACSASTSSSSADANSSNQAAEDNNSVQAGSESGSAQSAAGDDSSNGNAIYGSVKAIDGSSITLELGTLNQDAVPDGNGAQQGQLPSGDGQAPEEIPSGQPADMPSGQPSGRPSGQPSGVPSDGGRPSMLTLTGEIITIDLTDESVITVPEFSLNAQESSQTSDQATGLDLIRAGSVLKVVYGSDNETIPSVTVISGFRGGKMQDGPSSGNKPSPSASAS